MLPHATPLPRTAASMLTPHPIPSRATPAAVAAGVLLFPCLHPDRQDGQRAALRRVIGEMLDQPKAVARLTAAAKMCGADWRDAERVALLRALQKVPASRCAALPAVQPLLAGGPWMAPGNTLRWALEAEAKGQLPVWAAHGILPRLEHCKHPQRTVTQLKAIPSAQMRRFWERVEVLCRGSRQAAAVPMDQAVDACVRLPAAHVSGILRAVATAGRPALAPVALAMGLFPTAIGAVGATLDRLPPEHAQDASVLQALAQVAQNEPRGLPRRVALAAALRLDATGLVAVCSVPARSWDAFAYEAQRRIGSIASSTQRVLDVQALARRQRSFWQSVAHAGQAALRWLGGGASVAK